ncbi:MAG: hypothetical protein IJA19_06870, partial [Clostridia bacterium]|nr:hypothetical protein [Clostridia bacterium]
MGLRQLLEDRLKIRFRPSPTMMDEIPVTSEDEDLANSVAGGEQGSLIDVAELQKFRSLSRYRNERFAAYEDMMSDPIIAAALEMYADDATQYNDEGQVIWVESDNPDIAKAGTRLLDVLGFNKNSWRYIYALCTYGEIYLELFNDGDTPNTVRNTDTDMVKINPEEKVRKLQEYIEYVNDPSTVFELQTRGKTSGYIRVPEEQLNTKNDMYKGMYLSTIPKSSMELHNRLKFIHISLSESVNRHPECLGVENDDGTTTYYNIKTGKSILDDAYSVTQDTKLLEDSLLLN